MAASSPAQNTPPFIPLPSIPTPSGQRLQALYADFSRQKASNPSAYAANIDWWRRALPEIIAAKPGAGDKLVMHVDDSLEDDLRWEGRGRPLALGTVILEMLESNAIYPLSTYLSSTYSIYYNGSIPWRIASAFVGKPLWWLLEQMKLVGDISSSSESSTARWKRAKGQYVVRSNVQKAADAVLAKQWSQPRVSLTETLYNAASFRQEFGEVPFPGTTLSDTDVKVLLRYLERDRKAVLVDNEVIKFIDDDAMETEKITEVDHGVLEMKVATQRLQDQVTEIQRRISECTEKVKDLINKKQQEMAKSYLRSRKLLEEVLAKRLASLETVQGILIKIESAAGDIEVMKAYETSTSTLRTLLSHPSLQREHVDATMESMSEALADHAEIEEAIKLGGEGARAAAGVQDVDEGELEAELEGLVKEKEAEERAEEERRDEEKALRLEREAEEKAQKEKKEKERQEEIRRERREREEMEESRVEREQYLARRAEKRRAEGERRPQLAEGALGEDSDGEWRRRWDAGQNEKAAQAERDKAEDVRRRARWADEDARRAQADERELAD